MINLEFIKKQILSMDVESDEFFNLYMEINNKYWELEGETDDYQKSAKLLNMLSHSSNESLVITAAKITEQAFEILERKKGAVACDFKYGDDHIYFTIADRPQAIDKLRKIIENTATVKAREEGIIE